MAIKSETKARGQLGYQRDSMVDVMLVLLIIFMVITPMLQKGVSVNLAKTDNPINMPEADKEDASLLQLLTMASYLGRTRSRTRTRTEGA